MQRGKGAGEEKKRKEERERWEECEVLMGTLELAAGKA
jgi:hypothetical protein